MNRVIFLENVPTDGEAYAIFNDPDTSKAAFAWGPEYPYMDELPGEDHPDNDAGNGESGFKWFEFEVAAIGEMKSALGVMIDNAIFNGEEETNSAVLDDQEDEFFCEFVKEYVEKYYPDHAIAAGDQNWWDGHEWSPIMHGGNNLIVIYKNPVVDNPLEELPGK